MAKIIGQDGGGWTQVSSNDFANSGGAIAFAAGYIPLFNGNITSINVQFGSAGGGASQFKVGLYQGASPSTGGATLLAASGLGSIVANTLVNVAIASTLLSTGLTYSLWLSMTTSSFNTVINSGSSAFADSQYTAAHFPNSTLPSTTSNPRDSNTGHEFIIWGDGTASGTSNNQEAMMLGIGS